MPRFYNVYGPFSDRKRHRFDRRGYASFVLLERFRFPSRECGFLFFQSLHARKKKIYVIWLQDIKVRIDKLFSFDEMNW
jgi:hypothetical protein